MLEIKKVLDFSGDNNRGWIDHRVEAWLDGNKVGHLTISYITPERLSNHYPDGAIDYAGHIGGGPSRPAKGITKEYVALLYWHHNQESWQAASAMLAGLKRLDEAHSLEFYKNVLIPRYNKEYGKKFQEFIEYWVDYPIVSYISVDREHRGKGLGKRLYVEGGRLMHREFGLDLHSSTLQSESAEKVWESLVNDKVAKPAPLRKCDKNYKHKRGNAPRYMIREGA